jgi:hypothetical protein
MSKYGSPTDFLFGKNIHDFDPDKEGNRKVESGTPWYERAPEGRPDLSSLVSEIKSRISAITQFVKDEGTMINYEEKGSSKQQQPRKGSGGAITTLALENVSFDRKSARVLAVRPNIEGKYGKQAAIKIAYSGNTYIFYLGVSDTRLKQLIDEFGRDENKWVGREFLLYLENDEFNNRNSIHVDASVQASTSKKR